MSDKKNICGYCKKQNSEGKFPTFDIFGDEYTINQCNECKAFFLAPRPTEAQLNRAYDSFYYGEQEEKFTSPGVERVLDFFRQRRARRLTKYLKDRAKVLDIGCGNGRFLMHLLNFGNFNLYGTELEGNSAKRAAKIPEINLKIGMLKKDDFEPETFDAITLFHVFEHLTEPAETIETIAKIIKKNGVVVFSFPNIGSNQCKWFKGKWLHLDPPRHLFFFKREDFASLLNMYGFELVREHYLSSEQNPYGMIQSILNCWCRKRDVLFEGFKGNTNYINEYSKFNLLSQKLFFISTFPIFIITEIVAAWMKKSATVEFIFRKIK